jgi:CubicO group peptidase (beta-lactamase class C family)
VRTLSPEQKLAQLFFPVVDLALVAQQDTLVLSQGTAEPGGLVLQGTDMQAQQALVRSVLRDEQIPFFLMQQKVLFGPSPLSDEAYGNSWYVLGDTGFVSSITARVFETNAACGLQLFRLPDALYSDENYSVADPKAVLQFQLPFLRNARQAHMLPIGGKLRRTYDAARDSLFTHDTLLAPFKTLCDSGLACIEVDTSYFLWKKKNPKAPKMLDFCEDQLDFKGLISAVFPTGLSNRKALLKDYFSEGIEVMFTGSDHFEVLAEAQQMLKSGELQQDEIDRRLRKILLAKSWVREKFRVDSAMVAGDRELDDAFARGFQRRMTEASLVLLRDDKGQFPYWLDPKHGSVLIAVGVQPESFLNEFRRYGELKNVQYHKDWNAFSKAKLPETTKASQCIFLCTNPPADPAVQEGLKKIKNTRRLVLVHMGHERDLSMFSFSPTLIHVFGNTPEHQKAAARFVSGAGQANGKLPRVSGVFALGAGMKKTQSRLEFTVSEEVGIRQDSLYRIDAIVDEAIRNRALPGGQVLMALDGKIIYHKVFGHHTYDRKTPVAPEHLYDMASVTKVAATTLMSMHFYEKGKFRLDDSLRKHLPDSLKKIIPGGSTLENVTFREILIHASGLPAGQNIIRFMRFDEEFSATDLYYCDAVGPDYNVPVGDSFYLSKYCVDSLWYDLNRIWLDPSKPYKYSDANMNLMYSLLRPMVGKQKWERYIDSLFFAPLGMKHTSFIPLQRGFKKEEIAPTEQDRYWRKQLVQGYVHDPTAALYGGVAGNAGLFSNAYDMAVLFQMFLQKGVYGGRRYLNAETVELFTSHQSGTHRGLGFNMQVSGSTYGCSPAAHGNTFGHTGFTGTAVWVDPELRLVYVFISNRVHPDPENKKIIQLGTTKRIHNVIYELLGRSAS